MGKNWPETAHRIASEVESEKAMETDEAVAKRNVFFDERCFTVMMFYSTLCTALARDLGEAGIRLAVNGLLLLVWQNSDITETCYQ